MCDFTLPTPFDCLRTCFSPSSPPIFLSLNEHWIEKQARLYRFEWLTRWVFDGENGCAGYSDLNRPYLFRAIEMGSFKCIVSSKLPYKSFQTVMLRETEYQKSIWPKCIYAFPLSLSACVRDRESLKMMSSYYLREAWRQAPDRLEQKLIKEKIYCISRNSQSCLGTKVAPPYSHEFGRDLGDLYLPTLIYIHFYK